MQQIFVNDIVYNKDVIARNILFHNEIVQIAENCAKQNIKLILLKGAALIEMFPEYSFFRELEDIDVLVEKRFYKKFKSLLLELGYEEVLYDPKAMFNKQKNVEIDIETKIWYLDTKKNQEIINSAVHLSKYNSETNCYVLEPKDMLEYIYVHSYVHHSRIDSRWERDIKLIKEKFGLEKVENKFKDKYKFFLENKIVYKGYVLRFLFLPFKQKISYFIETFFPSVEFIFLRYGIKPKKDNFIKYIFLIIQLYLKRWSSLIFKTLCFVNNFVKTLFLTKWLKHT